MNTLKLIDALEEMLESSHKVPLTSNIMVKGDELLDLINEIRDSFQEEVKKARQIVREREQMIESAKREADMIIKGVEANIENMISETAVKRKADQRSAEVEEEAHRKAMQLAVQSENYSEEILNTLDNYINKCLVNIKEAKRQLTAVKTKKNL